MANVIIIKNSSTASSVPTTGDLALGELAINTYDGKLYLKKDDGTAAVVEIGAGGGAADALSTTGADVDVAAATAPTTGQVLTATSGTAATWQTLGGGAADSLSTTGTAVAISAAAPPSTGQALIATSATAATWQVIGTSTNTGNTVVRRDASGDLHCRLLRSQYTTTSTNCSYFLTQNAVGTGDNYARPSTLAQVKAKVLPVSKHVRFTGRTSNGGCTLTNNVGITSVTRTATGTYTVAFPAMVRSTYNVQMTIHRTSGASSGMITIKYGSTPTTTSFILHCGNTGGTSIDNLYGHISIIE